MVSAILWYQAVPPSNFFDTYSLPLRVQETQVSNQPQERRLE
jgi:hypothetical protein